MLRIENLTYRIGARVLLDHTGVAINEGHRVGLVGRNGTGKTTLLKLVSGAVEADEGDITWPGRWRMGVTSQEAPDGPESLIQTVLASDHELTALLAEAETATDPDRIAHIHTELQERGAHSARSRAAVSAANAASTRCRRLDCGACGVAAASSRRTTVTGTSPS